MTRTEVLNALAQILHDNIGQKLTLALANGLLTTLNERMPADAAAQTEKAEPA